MIRNASNIIDHKFKFINILDGVRKVQDIFYKYNIEYFIVKDEDNIVGILTKKELIGGHPNRIAADVMSTKYRIINKSLSIWNIKEIFDRYQNYDMLLVEEDNKIVGIVTKAGLMNELSKHIDLLTGLYKSDYIFYNAINLFKKKNSISIIFIDLDNFGDIDKKYGHINGDLILKSVANILKSNVYNDTYLCRYAGDEFAVLTPYCEEKSKVLTENLVNSIKISDYPLNIPVSASAGICCGDICNLDDIFIINTVKEMVNIASLASTKAKNNKQNRVYIENFSTNLIS